MGPRTRREPGPMGPPQQPDRAERPVVVSAPPARPDAPPAADAPGLTARKAAAKLLAAVIDARTPLDGLTDAEHGHPLYRALDGRDRSLVRAILATALRFRGT